MCVNSIVNDDGGANEEHSSKKGGWVLKAPFVSNSMYYLYKNLGDLDTVVDKIANVVSDQCTRIPKCYRIPYMMLQVQSYYIILFLII